MFASGSNSGFDPLNTIVCLSEKTVTEFEISVDYLLLKAASLLLTLGKSGKCRKH